MGRRSRRNIASALAAAAVIFSLPASAAEIVTVHCLVESVLGRARTPKFDQMYFLDISAGKFCDASCREIYNIEAATDRAIVLHWGSTDTDETMVSPGWRSSVTIDRKSGAMTGSSITNGASMYRRQLTGRCTFLPFLPTPVANVLRSAPSTDRATLVPQ